ncbi:hypothetical protein SLE2022_118520 [Rubroshorea leprosula]
MESPLLDAITLLLRSEHKIKPLRIISGNPRAAVEEVESDWSTSPSPNQSFPSTAIIPFCRLTCKQHVAPQKATSSHKTHQCVNPEQVVVRNLRNLGRRQA